MFNILWLLGISAQKNGIPKGGLKKMIFSAGSERNIGKLSLDGVDVMGERLSEEVNFF